MLKLSKEIEKVEAESAENIKEMGRAEVLAEISLWVTAIIGIIELIKKFTGAKADRKLDSLKAALNRAQELSNFLPH